ncbi:hypothetical protein LDENG_00219020 [Lucifuga dentata]|nr:hypothetical protein LDENG_00219020 [Lucifuga dentata]
MESGSAGSSRAALVFLGVVLYAFAAVEAWDADLELLDLVEEIPQTFYQFMSVEQDASAADIRKAYRRLSLTLHPDKNKDENAEIQFRQLVAIYEVLKDEERRRTYDDILVNGLPDWRQPVFYYRRVRKMSNMELAFLLFLILTVGHYAIIWSIYLEKQLDELLSKKKKEKKKKLSSKPAEQLKCIGLERSDRPQWQDILPLKLSIWIYLSAKNLPQTLQEVKQYYEEYRHMKEEQREQKEHTEAQQEAAAKEKRPKVKKPKVEFPVYEPSSENASYQSYDQTTSIQDIEDQMDYWLQDCRAAKKKAADWTEDELSLLSRLMVKFPGGTPGRWEKIAHELGRSVSEVTSKVRQVKDNVNNTSGLVKMSELKGSSATWKLSSLPVPDSLMTQRESGVSKEGGAFEQQEEEEEEEEGAPAIRQRNRKATGSEGSEVRVRGRRQRDFDPVAALEEEAEPQVVREKAEGGVWTQNQQKLLEVALQQLPRGTAERWDRIAKVVPGKTKEECMIRYKMSVEQEAAVSISSIARHSYDGPIMSLRAMLQERIGFAHALVQRAEQLSQPHGMEGSAKLCGKLQAELRFLRRVEAGELVVKESHLHSTNLTHLTAIVESAESLEGVVAVLHVFTYRNSTGTKQTLVVDVVANGGHTWVKAVGRKAEALHNIWQGRGQYGDKNIIRQAEDFLQASHQQPVQYCSPHVIFAFYNGVSSPMADHLRNMGISVRGDIVAVNALVKEEGGDEVEDSEEQHDDDTADEDSDPTDEDESELGLTKVDRGTVVASLAFPVQVKVEACQRVNLDITTLITYVSSLSHGCCHFTFREHVLTEQAAQERHDKVLPRLDDFMKGKELFACRSAVDDFQLILDTLAGSGEKERARQLLARLRVVDDQPSERTVLLTPSAKINRRSLMIFGTGDSLRAVTMTANSRFVRAATNQGVRYSVFIHQPRALTEGKEWRATPI